MHLTALPGSSGIGDLGAAAHEFVDSLANAGLSVWQFLPTGPTAYGDSPYQPLSTFAGNPLLIAVDEFVELGLLTHESLQPLTTLSVDNVEYGAVIEKKTQLIDRAAQHFRNAPGHNLHNAFYAFIAQNDHAWLHDFALFSTLKKHHDQRPWPKWETAYRQREPQALLQFATDHATAIHAIKFAQFMFYRQWSALRAHASKHHVLLFGDMPIYIALDCADAWANKGLLRIDTDGTPAQVAGVPPDYFSEDGQLWGNPLYDWNYHHDTGFAWWIARIRHTLANVDIVRIDHFRGFEAFWAVPAGATTARDGAWEPGPNDALFDAIRNALGELPIVAEDLGEITPAVDALRARQRMPGMAVLQFMITEPEFNPASIGEDRVVYTGTHDNNTTVGWFRGGDGDARSPEQIQHDQYQTISKTGGNPDDIHWGLIKIALHCPAYLAIVPIQDFLGLGSEARFNTPGKPADNWCWRLAEGIFDATLQAQIRNLVASSGRLS